MRFAERIKMEGDREGYRGLVGRCGAPRRAGEYGAVTDVAAAWPSVFGDSPGAAALQHEEIVIKVSLRDRLCQVVSHCLVHGHLRRYLNEQSLRQCDRTRINPGSYIVFQGRSDRR